MNISSSTDTIAAIASAPGPSRRGIVRISGPLAISIASMGFVGFDMQSPPLRAQRFVGSLSVSGLRLPVPASCVVWPGQKTYTGQPIAEIHTIGAPPVLEAIVADCLSRGARLADPGEFTLRAFLSGRLDLTKAEAVLGVIDAETPSQLKTALTQLAGGVSEPLELLRDRLLDVLAHLEANLDFAEEPDVDPLGRAKLADELAAGSQDLKQLASQLQSRTRFEALPKVVLAGPPNAGKSRLFNALSGEERAIVSPQAGTTRDYLSAAVSCDGLVIELIDTAGIDAAVSDIEDQAQTLGRAQASHANLLVECRSADDGEHDAHPSPSQIQIVTKSDLSSKRSESAIFTSAATGEGIDRLRSEIASRLREQMRGGVAIASTSSRCRESLIRAGDALQSAALSLSVDAGDELVAIDLHQTLDELGRVVGRVVSDDILDRIFGRFCIGK